MNEISLHILDILQNSLKAGATLITLEIVQNLQSGRMEIAITDNGSGMSGALLEKVTSPFVTSRTTRKVGLGISLYKAAAEGTGGTFAITSELGKGTSLAAVFETGHLDCPPMGDLTGTMVAQIMCHPEVDFLYRHVTEKGNFELDTREIKNMLGEVGIDTPEVIAWLRDSITSELSEIGVS